MNNVLHEMITRIEDRKSHLKGRRHYWMNYGLEEAIRIIEQTWLESEEGKLFKQIEREYIGEEPVKDVVSWLEKHGYKVYVPKQVRQIKNTKSIVFP